MVSYPNFKFFLCEEGGVVVDFFMDFGVWFGLWLPLLDLDQFFHFLGRFENFSLVVAFVQCRISHFSAHPCLNFLYSIFCLLFALDSCRTVYIVTLVCVLVFRI